jgi:hypothetical protein
MQAATSAAIITNLKVMVIATTTATEMVATAHIHKSLQIALRMRLSWLNSQLSEYVKY